MNSKSKEPQRKTRLRNTLNEKKPKIKSIWSEEEDENLRQLVNKFGPINWSKIAHNHVSSKNFNFVAILSFSSRPRDRSITVRVPLLNVFPS